MANLTVTVSKPKNLWHLSTAAPLSIEIKKLALQKVAMCLLWL